MASQQIGASVDPEVWRKFKEKHGQGNASKRLEELMKWDLEFPELPEVYSGDNIRSITFSLDNWNAQLSATQLQVNNLSYTTSSSIVSDGTSCVDIKIE
jgi:hypothetical protein